MSKGGIIGKSNNPITTLASGVWDLHEQYLSQKDDTWPIVNGPINFKEASSVGTATSSTSLVISVPSSVSEGDVMVAVAIGRLGGGNWTQASWNKAYQRNAAGYPVLFYKIASANEPASYTFTNASSANYSGGILIFTPGSLFTTGTATTDSDPLVTPSIDIPTIYSQLLAFYAISDDNRTATTPSGMTSRLLHTGTLGSPAFGVFTESVNEGATGTRSSSFGTTLDTTGILFGISR